MTQSSPNSSWSSPNTSSSKAKTAPPSTVISTSRSTTLRARNIRPSSTPWRTCLGLLRRIHPSRPTLRRQRIRRPATNPRGSTGYGENFAKAIYADWGNKDIRTTWPSSTMPSHKVSPTQTSSPSAAGPMAASPLTSSSVRPPVSSRHLRRRRSPQHQLLRPRPLSARLGNRARPSLGEPRALG